MSKSIAEIDPNLRVASSVERPDIAWRSIRQDPFSIHGLHEPRAGGPFCRLPEGVARAASEGVAQLRLHTAGGRVRFCTNSRYVALHAEMPCVSRMAHMPLSGSSGFDLYAYGPAGERFFRAFIPPTAMANGYESILEFPSAQARDITINFPLYDAVDEVYLGLSRDCLLAPCRPYRIGQPVVFYGSSITQGGCASRPGNSYPAMIARRFDCEHANLGFSGNGKGEPAIAEHMASLAMSAFVSDYDHNAPSAEHLEATHARLYRAIRARHPLLPYLIVSKPDVDLNLEDSVKRRQVILRTYTEAREAGDENVRFVDGFTLFGEDLRDACTVDGCHPNDLGFSRMARGIGDALASFPRFAQAQACTRADE